MAVFAAAYRRHADPDALLADRGLTDKRRTAFRDLSGGQRQRLFIALALIGEPDVVVLDELTTGLDPAARRDTWELVRRLRRNDVTVLLVTHAMDEAETCATGWSSSTAAGWWRRARRTRSAARSPAWRPPI